VSKKPKDFIHWKDGQELEFLKHCKQCSENGEFWTNYAIYDLSNDDDLKKVEALGFRM
jgi:hypothetical protein